MHHPGISDKAPVHRRSSVPPPILETSTNGPQREYVGVSEQYAIQYFLPIFGLKIRIARRGLLILLIVPRAD